MDLTERLYLSALGRARIGGKRFLIWRSNSYIEKRLRVIGISNIIPVQAVGTFHECVFALPAVLLTAIVFIIIMLLIVCIERRANMTRNAISLFSSSGVGDLGLKANGIETVIGCELLEERMSLFHNNYPKAKCFQGDIWTLKNEIIDHYKENYADSRF